MTSRSEEHGEVIPAIRRLSRCGRATAAVDKDLLGADTGERRPCSTWLASASSEVSGMSAPDVVAARLNGQVLAPAGSNLVLAEWVAQASVGDEPLYQAPLHLHEEDEAWYVLEGHAARLGGRRPGRGSCGGSGDRARWHGSHLLEPQP